jgi:CBS domain containing-hemolysin-like protein
MGVTLEVTIIVLLVLINGLFAMWILIEQGSRAESAYSRFPVCRGRLDEVVGVVRTKDLQAPLSVPESMYVLTTLESFKRSGQHLALVTDEHGEMEGVV